MSKDAYYFSHDSNARNDEKILSLRMKLGMEGYGIYWAIIEMLRDSSDYRMRLYCERIAFELHTDKKHIESVIHDFELFDSDGDFFWSESLLRRMEIKEKKSDKARESAKARWDKANAMRAHSESNASKGKEKKESKGKEKKGKEDFAVNGSSLEYKNICKLWFEFVEKRNGVKPSFSAVDGKSLKSIIAYISKEQNEGQKTEDTFKYILDRWPVLSEWLQSNALDLKIFSSKINTVLDQIKNGKGKKFNSEAYDKHLRANDPNYHNY